MSTPLPRRRKNSPNSGTAARRKNTGRRMQVMVASRTPAGRPHVGLLARHLRTAAGLLDGAPAEVSIVLVGDAEMSRLHERFMGMAGPTDVLSFPLEPDGSGEVVVCLPEAVRQAALRAVPVQSELLLYALHGTLHLCGHDDRTPRAYQAMHRKEDQLLTALGFGPVFSRGREAPSARRRAASQAGKRRAGR